MGYTTDFYGEVTVTPPLNSAEIEYLTDFATSRRVHRTRGPLYANPGSSYRQPDEADVLSHSSPDPDQPGLWCQWIPNEDGTALTWDQGENFYNAAEWMDYLANRLLGPSAATYVAAHIAEDLRLAKFTCDHRLDGRIDALGEDPEDRWLLEVTDNQVRTLPGTIVYLDPATTARLGELQDALAAVTTMTQTLGTEEIGNDVGGHMTCTEADALARVMHRFGDTEAATWFLLGHCRDDEDGDQHFWNQVTTDPGNLPTAQMKQRAQDYALAL